MCLRYCSLGTSEELTHGARGQGKLGKAARVLLPYRREKNRGSRELEVQLFLLETETQEWGERMKEQNLGVASEMSSDYLQLLTPVVNPFYP